MADPWVVIQGLTSDSLLIWRLKVIWASNRRVSIAPLALLSIEASKTQPDLGDAILLLRSTWHWALLTAATIMLVVVAGISSPTGSLFTAALLTASASASMITFYCSSFIVGRLL